MSDTKLFRWDELESTPDPTVLAAKATGEAVHVGPNVLLAWKANGYRLRAFCKPGGGLADPIQSWVVTKLV